MTNKWLVRFASLAAALAITLGFFLFWGKLGAAFSNAMAIVYAEPKPVRAKPENPGEVTAIVIAVPQHCDQHNPCPPPKP